jgi:hypothetical protein
MGYDSLLAYCMGREIEEGILLDKVHSSFAALFLLILSGSSSSYESQQVARLTKV